MKVARASGDIRHLHMPGRITGRLPFVAVKMATEKTNKPEAACLGYVHPAKRCWGERTPTSVQGHCLRRSLGTRVIEDE
jgi:hypothetical protein